MFESDVTTRQPRRSAAFKACAREEQVRGTTEPDRCSPTLFNCVCDHRRHGRARDDTSTPSGLSCLQCSAPLPNFLLVRENMDARVMAAQVGAERTEMILPGTTRINVHV